MSPFPYPQAYVDCELPVRPDGTRLERPRSSEENDYYINWLADYLYTTDIPIPDCQKDITADILCLAEEMTITPVLDDIEYYVESGEGFAKRIILAERVRPIKEIIIGRALYGIIKEC